MSVHAADARRKRAVCGVLLAALAVGCTPGAAPEKPAPENAAPDKVAPPRGPSDEHTAASPEAGDALLLPPVRVEVASGEGMLDARPLRPGDAWIDAGRFVAGGAPVALRLGGQVLGTLSAGAVLLRVPTVPRSFVLVEGALTVASPPGSPRAETPLRIACGDGTAVLDAAADLSLSVKRTAGGAATGAACSAELRRGAVLWEARAADPATAAGPSASATQSASPFTTAMERMGPARWRAPLAAVASREGTPGEAAAALGRALDGVERTNAALAGDASTAEKIQLTRLRRGLARDLLWLWEHHHAAPAPGKAAHAEPEAGIAPGREAALGLALSMAATIR